MRAATLARKERPHGLKRLFRGTLRDRGSSCKKGAFIGGAGRREQRERGQTPKGKDKLSGDIAVAAGPVG